MKNHKICRTFAIILMLFLSISLVSASADDHCPGSECPETICIYLFEEDYGCPKCNYLYVSLEEEFGDKVNIIIHNINDDEGRELYEEFKQTYSVPYAGFPIAFIGDSFFVGEKLIADNLKSEVQKCVEEGCPCPISKIRGITPAMPRAGDYTPEGADQIEIPVIGVIDVSEMPLYLMTFIVSFVDGFNPCSLWVLAFLLGIVIFTKSRKKVFLVGITFLLVTATAYGLFIVAILNVFTYIAYDLWIRIIVSSIAAVFAFVNIKDYFWYKKGISFTISDKQKPGLFSRMRKIISLQSSIPAMIGAVAVMALGVTLIELPCTAGLPMIWAGIIATHDVSFMTFLSLLLLYLFVYLMIELVIFLAAVFTLKSSRFEESHGRILKLIGGIIMASLAYGFLFMHKAMSELMGTIRLFGAAFGLAFLVLIIHRKILPRFGILIGTEDLGEEKSKQNSEKKKEQKSKNSESNEKRK